MNSLKCGNPYPPGDIQNRRRGWLQPLEKMMLRNESMVVVWEAQVSHRSDGAPDGEPSLLPVMEADLNDDEIDDLDDSGIGDWDMRFLTVFNFNI